MLVYGLRPLYQAIYHTIKHPGGAYLLCVLATLLVLIPLAHIVYRLVETTSINAGKRLINHLFPAS